jgi:hypothetical protein
VNGVDIRGSIPGPQWRIVDSANKTGAILADFAAARGGPAAANRAKSGAPFLDPGQGAGRRLAQSGRMGITERIDAVTSLPAAGRWPPPPPPRSVKIELTARCNFACTFCAKSLQLREQDEMDPALFRRLATEIRAAGVEEIGLFYLGESFLVDWLPEAIRFAKDCGFPYVFLTTNGSRAGAERVEACMAAGLDSLKFSLNYADPAQFHAITRASPRLFHEVIANLKTARQIRDRGGYRTGLYASYILYDGEQGERMRAVVDEVSPHVDEIYALPLYNQADLTGQRMRDLGWKPGPGNRGRIGALRDPLPCWAVFNEGHITWDGKLAACCFDHDGRFEMGDLTRTAFIDAWHSAAFQELRQAHLRRDVTGTACQCCVGGG